MIPAKVLTLWSFTFLTCKKVTCLPVTQWMHRPGLRQTLSADCPSPSSLFLPHSWGKASGLAKTLAKNSSNFPGFGYIPQREKPLSALWVGTFGPSFHCNGAGLIRFHESLLQTDRIETLFLILPPFDSLDFKSAYSLLKVTTILRDQTKSPMLQVN